MKKIKCLIFSKDRSFQLDALLNSLYVNCPNLFEPIVIYKWSNDEFLLGYNLLRAKTKIPNIEWIVEDNLQTDILQILNDNINELICLSTDDCIFYKQCNKNYDYFANLFESNNQLLTFSFRLGLNTIVQNYVTGETQPSLLKFNPKSIDNDTLMWNFNLCWDQYNFGYCFSHDHHIYRGSDLHKMIGQFQTIPSLRVIEGGLSQRKNRECVADKNYMGCFGHSCVVNVPVNTAQADEIYLGAKQRFTLEQLNKKYIDCEYLALDKMDFSGIIGAHQEVEYKFTREYK